MQTAVKAGLILAAIVTAISLVIGLTGLNTNVVLGAFGAPLLFLVINVFMVWWSLKRTAPEFGYGKQVLSGLVLGLVGGLTILITSWLMLSLLFPDYLTEMGAAVIESMENADVPQDRIDAQAAQFERATPFSQALAGTIGTLVTSLIASLVIAIFKRRK